ncbi:uncharacterized protein [Lepeophtheirus salmonis]|uniref:uncharacterized protein isoform X2 n=1 Tax=Lepeophtheirus salmonis TaxID=72036 RepID=UPI003AF3CC68
MSRFNDFDEDDPLAGLLSDEEEEKPIRKTLASLSTTEISKNTSKGLIEVKKEADGIMKQDSMPSFSEPVQQYKAPSSAFMDSLFGRTSEKTESKSLRGIFDTNDQELEKPKFAITKTLETEKRTISEASNPLIEGKRSRRGGGRPTLQPKSVEDIFMDLEMKKKKNEQKEAHLLAPETETRIISDQSKNIINQGHYNMLEGQISELKNIEQTDTEIFKKDFEQQRVKLENKNQEYKNALDQQKFMCEEQIRMLSNKQTDLFRKQQEQFSILMKQFQNQTESEVRMKSELIRNQIQLMGNFQVDQGNLPKTIGIDYSNNDFNKMIESAFKETITQLKSIHEDNMQELNERIESLLDRIRVLQEIHREELEKERDKRFRQLEELEEEHKNKIVSLKDSYENIIHSLKNIDNNADLPKALDTLISQVVGNTEGLGTLYNKVESDVSIQTNVREALLRSKENQLDELRGKLNDVIAESAQQIDQLTSEIHSLQDKLRNNEGDLDKKNYALEIEKRALESEKKFFEMEKVHLMSKMKRDQDTNQEFYEEQKKHEKMLRKKFEKELRAIRAERSKLIFSKKLSRRGSLHFTELIENLPENIDPDIFGLFHALKDKEDEYTKKLNNIIKKEQDIKADEKLIRDEKDIILQSIEKLGMAEKEVNEKLTVLQNMFETTSEMREECLELLEETSYKENNIFYLCQEIENKAIQIRKKQKSLETQTKNIRKEREKLRSKEDKFICKFCESHEVGISKSKFTSDLGIRTDADGQNPIHSSAMDFQKVKEDALKSSKYLQRESQFLRTVSMSSLI